MEEGADFNQIVTIEGIEVPIQIQQLYQVHPLQPFDVTGFHTQTPLRYQDQWFAVAQQLTHGKGNREPWVNQPYRQITDDVIVLDAGQWIQDVTFPARLYLKTLGVENLKPQDLPAQDPTAER